MKTQPKGTRREDSEANGVRATLTALRAAVADKAKYAREWCTERSGGDGLENGRLCLCSHLRKLKVDSNRVRATIDALLEYTTNREPWRSECARLHAIAPDHAAAVRVIDRALNDRGPERTPTAG